MKKISFLLIDDDEAYRRYYNDLLSQSLTYPIQIIDAENGQEALTLLKEKHIDCILLNYTLPDMDGLSLLKKIKVSCPNHPPIIFLTAAAEDRKLAADAIKAGAQDFLVKTTTTPELVIKTVSQFINESHLQKKEALSIQLITLYMAGTLVSLLGLLFIYGWVTHVTPIIQIKPNLTPIKFNAALGLFIAGLGMLAYVRLPRISKLLGLITLLIGSFTLVEYIFSIDMGLDQFFITAYLDTNTSYPGRLAPNAALYFSLIGIILLIHKPLVAGWDHVHGGFILSVLLTLAGFGGALGYLTHQPIAYGWGNWAEMSIQTAVGITILGMGFSLFFWYDDIIKDKKNSLLPCAIIVSGALFFIYFWQSFVENDYQKIVKNTQNQANLAKELITLKLNGYLTLTSRMNNKKQIAQLKNATQLTNKLFQQLPEFHDYGIELLSNNRIVFQQNNQANKFKTYWSVSVPITIKNNQWLLKMWPTERLVNYGQSWFPIIGSLAGLVITFLLAFIIRVLQATKEKSVALQNSELKFRTLLNTTSDVMLIVNQRGEVILANLAATTLMGYSQEEIVSMKVESLMPERFRDKHVSYRNTYMKYPTARMMSTAKNLFVKTNLGEEIPVEIGLNPIQLEEEQCVLCTIHDMRQARENENKLIQQSHAIQVMLDITNAIANEENFVRAMQHCLAIICSSFQWQIGHIYLVDEENPEKLIPSTIWYFSDPDPLKDFYNTTMENIATYGVGLPGRILASGLPVWIEDIDQEKNYAPIEIYKTSNIHSAFGFAIKRNEKTIGIVELFSYEKRPQDNNFLLVITILGNQINRFLEYQAIQVENKQLATRFQFAIKAGKIGVWEWNLITNKIHWDEQMFVLYGLDPINFKGEYSDWEKSVHPDDKEQAVAALNQAVREQKPFNAEFRIITPNGEIRYIAAKATILYAKNGTPKSFLGLNWDITKDKNLTTELKELNQTLEHYAYYDSLTGLMNRHAFLDAAKRLLAQAKRHHIVLGFLFIDLDNFKNINDSLGHAAGDKVLIETAKRINKTLRSEDLICRLGGDEFAVVINDIKTLKVETIAAKLIDNLKQVFKINNHTIHIGASIGISYYPDSAETISELLNKADKMLLQAKSEGRGRYKIYSGNEDSSPSQ